MALDALYALVFMCPGPRSNANKISALSALVKLNLPPSKDWTTWSTANSVGRFFVARPSLNCATKPYPPGTTLVLHAVTS